MNMNKKKCLLLFSLVLIGFNQIAFAVTPFINPLLETLLLPTGFRKSYSLNSLQTPPLELFYHLNILPDLNVIPDPAVSLSDEAQLVCALFPEKSGDEDQESQTALVICAARDTIVTKDMAPPSSKGVRQEAIHNALLAMGASENTIKSKNNQEKKLPDLSSVFSWQHFEIPASTVTVYMLRSSHQSNRSSEAQVWEGQSLGQVRAQLGNREPAVLPQGNRQRTLRLRPSSLSDENIQQTFLSAREFIENRNHDNEQLLSIAERLHIVREEIDNNVTLGRARGVSIETEVVLRFNQDEIRRIGHERNQRDISLAFANAHRLLYGRTPATLEQISSLRTQLESLSKIITWFGSPADQGNLKSYLEETKKQQHSAFIQPARDRNIRLLQDFNGSPEHCNQISITTIEALNIRVDELFDELNSDNTDRDRLAQLQTLFSHTQEIIRLINEEPGRLPGLQAAELNSQSVLFFTLRNNRISMSLNTIATRLNKSAINPMRLSELHRQGLDGRIDPEIVSAMSETDFALIIALLKGESVSAEQASDAGFGLTQNNRLLANRGHSEYIVRDLGSGWQRVEHSRSGTQIASGSPDEIARIIGRAGGDINRVTRRHFIDDAREFPFRDWMRRYKEQHQYDEE